MLETVRGANLACTESIAFNNGIIHVSFVITNTTGKHAIQWCIGILRV